MLQYAGSSWSQVESTTDRGLSGVWGSSSMDVYAGGEGGTILHFTGTRWNEMESGTDQTLIDVWGTSFANVYAVGYGGTILHYDGASWSSTRRHLYLRAPVRIQHGSTLRPADDIDVGAPCVSAPDWLA